MSNHKVTAQKETRVLPLMVFNQPVSNGLTLAAFTGKTVTLDNLDAPANAFVVELSANTMAPLFPKGTQLIAVKKTPQSGALVLVYSHEERTIMVCRYFKEGSFIALSGVVDHHVIAADHEDIIGVLVESRYNLK